MPPVSVIIDNLFKFKIGIAKLDRQSGHLDGSVSVKVYSTITLETLAHWESDFLMANPSLQIHAVSKFTINRRPVVNVILLVWDWRWGVNENESFM